MVSPLMPLAYSLPQCALWHIWNHMVSFPLAGASIGWQVGLYLIDPWCICICPWQHIMPFFLPFWTRLLFFFQKTNSYNWKEWHNSLWNSVCLAEMGVLPPATSCFPFPRTLGKYISKSFWKVRDITCLLKSLMHLNNEHGGELCIRKGRYLFISFTFLFSVQLIVTTSNIFGCLIYLL